MLISSFKLFQDLDKIKIFNFKTKELEVLYQNRTCKKLSLRLFDRLCIKILVSCIAGILKGLVQALKVTLKNVCLCDSP